MSHSFYITRAAANDAIDFWEIGNQAALDAIQVLAVGTGAPSELGNISDTVGISLNPCNSCDYALLTRWAMFENAVSDSTNGGAVELYLRHCCCC